MAFTAGKIFRLRNLIFFLLGGLVFLGAWFFFVRTTSRERAANKTAPQVLVVKPKTGGMERLVKLPGTIHAFKYEELKAAVSGFLINQKVDLGTKVHAKEVLAEIYAPELVKERDLAAANLEKAKAQVTQMEAHREAADASVKRANSLVRQRRAEVTRAKSVLKFRESKYNRFDTLAKKGGVVSDVYVEEEFQQMEAARSGLDAAEAAVDHALDEVAFRKAELAQAEADIGAAKANQKIAEAALAKADQLVDYTKIRSHYDGIITHRAFHDGTYIAAADKGGPALYAIKAMDTMRVIVQVPAVDVPFADPGDPVDLVIAELPKDKVPKGLKVARVADGQQERTRTMRVEVDLPNKNGYLRDGMYCEVIIHLEEGDPNAYTVRASALHEERGKPRLYLVRGGRARIVPVVVSRKDGRYAEIRSGLRPGDLVIVDHPGALRDDMPVEPQLEEAEDEPL